MALTDIRNFATGKHQVAAGFPVVGSTWIDSLTGASSGTSRSVLAFANTTAAPPKYGGDFGLTNAWCVPNYYENVSSVGAATVGATVSPASFATTGTYVRDGDLTFNPGTFTALGQKVVLKVNGNVRITGGEVKYGPTTDHKMIPQFQLLVNGDIYVYPGVTRLDGFYDAQGTNGWFISCAGAGSGLDVALIGQDNVDTCSNALTVNGAVAARQLVLNRTGGDRNGLYGRPQTPAEKFQFSPQFWLPDINDRTDIGRWQSVTSLPPIL